MHLDSCESTNVTARNLAEQGEPCPLWIRADVQTRGRGRRGREWISGSGNLYTSGLYIHEGNATEAALTGFVASIAVAETIEAYVPLGVSVKWPNDVLINGAKTAGILLEKCDNRLIIGIGINLMYHPEDTLYPTTHIMAHMLSHDLETEEPGVPEPRTVLAILAARFEHWRHVQLTQGFAAIRSVWLRRAVGVPGRVTVNLKNDSFSGYAQTLGTNGALQVRLDNGTIRDVHVGEVFFEGT